MWGSSHLIISIILRKRVKMRWYAQRHVPMSLKVISFSLNVNVFLKRDTYL